MSFALENWGSAYSQAIGWRNARTTMEVADDLNPVSFLTNLLKGEIREAEQERPELFAGQVTDKFISELCDILVFLFAICHKLKIDPDFTLVMANANGQAKHIDIFEKLQQLTEDIDNENSVKTINLFLVYFTSYISALPVEVNLAVGMSKVVKKNNHDRPAADFSDRDPINKENTLSTEEQFTRFVESTRRLRRLRNIYGSPLSSFVHESLAGSIQNFKQIDYPEFESDVAKFDQRLLQQTSQALLGLNYLPRNILEMGLQRMGAVDLSYLAE
jgi:hypothetical protein